MVVLLPLAISGPLSRHMPRPEEDNDLIVAAVLFRKIGISKARVHPQGRFEFTLFTNASGWFMPIVVGWMWNLDMKPIGLDPQIRNPYIS